MIVFRRLAAVLTALALSVATLSTGLVPCAMAGGHGGDQPAADAAHVHHASAHEHNDGVARGAQAFDTSDQSGRTPSCPMMGPCALHLLASADLGAGGAAHERGRVAVSPALAPSTRTPAPEQPPPRA